MEEERAGDAERAAARLRGLVAALVAVATVAVVLAVVAFIQRNETSRQRALANDQAKEAKKQANIALEASREAEKRALEAEQQAEIAKRAKHEAERQSRFATSRQLAALSVAERDKRFDRSLLLAVAAFQTEPAFEARESLYQALQQRPGLTSFLHIPEGHVGSVAFSPDGRTIAAGCGATGVLLWDVAARKRLFDEPLRVKEGSVESVAFSADGKTIAGGFYVRGGVGGVLLWDVTARKRLFDEPLPVKGGEVNSVAFSPDGKTIAAGYGEILHRGGVVLWDVDFESWQRRAGQIANRNFTRKEWREYFPDTPYHATFPDLPVPPQVTPK